MDERSEVTNMTAAPSDEGGDPACWASLLCPNCGAIPQAEEDTVCYRCGQAYPVDDE